MIESATLRLRVWREDDVPQLLVLRNNVALQAQLLAHARGSDAAQVREWLQRRSDGLDGRLWVVADRASDEALGYVQITGLEPVDRRAELGICLAPQAQGRGRGRETLGALLPHLRNTQGLRKLSLRIRADNTAALRCYTGLGYEICGRLRQHVFIDGAWQDLVLMEVFLEPPCAA